MAPVVDDLRDHSVRFNISLARSPMITQDAMVFPVVTRGMIDPSATRRYRLHTP